MISVWQSSIARVDLIDYATVLAYLTVAIMSARAATHAKSTIRAREGTFWRITAALLVLLGANEVLDLQTLLTLVARAHAKANGWYDSRRSVQYAFVIGLSMVAFIVGGIVLWLTWRANIAVRLAFSGLVVITVFGVSRAASFYHLEDISSHSASGFYYGPLQEAAGILIVAAAATLYIHDHQRSD